MSVSTVHIQYRYRLAVDLVPFFEPVLPSSSPSDTCECIAHLLSLSSEHLKVLSVASLTRGSWALPPTRRQCLYGQTAERYFAALKMVG